MYAVQREHVLVDVGFPLEFERLVELGLGLADVTVQSWCKLFAALSNYSQLTAVLAALDRVSAEELPEATRYTIDAVVATRPFITSLDEHISKIRRYGALNANVVATAVLAGALRGIRVYDTPVLAESGLRYVAQMFDRGELRQGLLSKERVDPAVHKLGKQVIVATTKSQRGHAASIGSRTRWVSTDVGGWCGLQRINCLFGDRCD